MHIAFIGGGNMAEAIVGAVIRQKLAQPFEITVSDIDENKLANLARKYQVKTAEDNCAAVQGRDIIVLAVKPQTLAVVMSGLHGRLKPDQLVISIIAGKSINALSAGLGLMAGGGLTA